MQEQKNITEKQVNDEVKSVMENLWDQMNETIICDGNTRYKVARATNQDPGTFNKRANEKGNCEIKSIVQTLLLYGYTIEIKIIPLK